MEDKINTARIKENLIILTGLMLVGALIFLGAYFLFDIYRAEVAINTVTDTNSEMFKQINEVINVLDEKYIDDIDLEKMKMLAIEGILESTGDPYTRFVTNEEYMEMLVPTQTEYVGIGVNIIYDEETSGIKILNVMKDSSAMHAGIIAGDIIVAVEGIEVTKDNYSEAIDMIKGEEGTTVKLEILRDGSTFENSYLRQKVVSTNLDIQVYDDDVGYIKLLEFSNNISEEFKQAYEYLNDRENVNSLIIDLRGNPGGLLTEAVDIADQILPEGEIVKIVYGNGTEKIYTSDDDKKIDIPIVVLVNEYSASASEILAGAIKDSGRGTIIGKNTFGKGIVQTIEPLNSGIGALSITSSKYYTASGNEIHGVGISPNIDIDSKEEYKNISFIPYNEDIQLHKAIETLKSQM